MSRAWPWYKAYPQDFLDDTIGWPGDLKGAYRILLDVLYMHDGQVADDAAYLSAQTGVASKRKWFVIREELLKRGKIQIEDGYLTNYRALIETEIRRKTDDNLEINDSVSNKNNDLAKTEREEDLERTPNPLKGDGAALSFSKFYEGYPKPNKRARGKAEAQWHKLGPIDQQLALSSLQRAGYDFAKLPKGGPTPASFLRDRWFDRYGSGVAVPKDPDTRRLYDLVIGQSGDIGWTNFFAGVAQVRGRRIIVTSDFRRGLIAERYAALLRASGFELAGFALDVPASDGTALKGNVRRKGAQARKAAQARKRIAGCKPPNRKQSGSAMFPARTPEPKFTIPTFKVGGAA